MNPSRKGLNYKRLPVISWLIIALVVQSALAMVDAQGVVVLGTEQDIRKDDTPRCLENALEKTKPEPRIIPAREFRNALFPFFEPETAPKSAWELSMVLGKSKVQERIEKLGVRYLVIASGQTSSGPFGGPFTCVGGTYPACGGVATADKSTNLAALIWDLQNIEHQQSTDISAVGENVLIGFILPIPIIANTKKKACSLMAEEVSSFIKNENLDTAIPMSTEEIGTISGDVE